MNEPTAAGRARDLVAAFCGRHCIERIRLSPTQGATARSRVCAVDIHFGARNGLPAFKAAFSLQGEAAGVGNLVTSIAGDGDIVLAGNAQEGAPAVERIAAFLSVIERHVGKLQQEQSVQGTRFLGNSFVLHGTTVFTVVSDDDGRLGIEIHKGSERQPATLMAGNLLDGLYEGSIELVTGGER